MDEAYVKVWGQWKYLYRAVDRDGGAVDFLFRAHRDEAAARRFLARRRAHRRLRSASAQRVKNVLAF